MGHFAQATRSAKTQLRGASQGARALRGRVDADQLETTRGFMVKMLRRSPKATDLEDLQERVQDGWEPAPPSGGNGKGAASSGRGGGGKGAAEPDEDDAESDKADLLREVVVAAKSLRDLAKKLSDQARQGDEAYAVMAVPIKAIIRAPQPTIRFSADQMDEMLGLFVLFVTLLERYAKHLKGG